MNKKIGKIIATIELGLLSILPNYSIPQTAIQIQQQPSPLEIIIEDSNARRPDMPREYTANTSGPDYVVQPYLKALKDYLQKHVQDKEDMTNRVPLKWLNILPESMMGGVLGFTYLGENFMGRRADLTGKTARMVDIHESIHTPDEYETRRLTDWIMSKERSRYIK